MNRSRPAKIGVFIMVAAALLVGGILMFGGTRWLEPSRQAVLFFEESVDGLSVGSNVHFRGVQIGEVERLRLEIDPDTAEAVVVVTIRLTPGNRFGGGAEMSDSDDEFTLQEWVDKGLFAQLNSSSLLTGQLSILLNFDQDAGATTRDRETDLPQIPVVRSEIEQVRAAITEVDWVGLVERFDATMTSITELSDTLQSELDGVGDNIRSTSESTEALVEQVRDTLTRMEDVITDLADQAEITLDTTRDTMTSLGGEAENTLSGFNRLSENANTTLTDFSELSRESSSAIAELSEQMSRTLTSVERVSNTADDTLDGQGEALGRVLAQTEQTLDSIRRVTEQLEDITHPRSQERDDLQTTLRNLSAASAAIERIADMIERDPQSIFLGNEGDQR